MSKAKFVPILLILLVFGFQAFVSCSSENNTDTESSSSTIGGGSLSSSIGGGGSSSSIGVGGSSSSIGGGGSSSSSSSFQTWSSGSESEEWYCEDSEPKQDELIYGDDYTDSRNGGNSEVYKTVKIGNQIWMAKNLNYKPSSAPGLHKCYAEGYGNGEDDWLRPDIPEQMEEIELNCSKFGRLYDWKTAKTVCPPDWHLPDALEWDELKEHIDSVVYCKYQDVDLDWDVGTKLKATSGWKDHPEYGNGVDTYGFGAVGAGFCYNCTRSGLTSAAGNYEGRYSNAYWWSATEYRTDKAWRFSVSYDNNVLSKKTEDRTDLYSVRCVKN